MEEKSVLKKYTNGETTVIWNSAKCLHTGICLGGLPKVFNLRQRPWIDMTADSTSAIEQQVNRCPSGALSIEGKETQINNDTKNQKVVLTPKGPLTLFGKVELLNLQGKVVDNLALWSFPKSTTL